MPKKPSIVEEVRRAIEARGYQRYMDVPGLERGDVYYRHASSTDEVVHVLGLGYVPTYKGYGVGAGVYSPQAIRLLDSWLPVLKKFLHPLLAEKHPLMEDSVSPLTSPCWQSFDAARALNWTGFVVPELFNRERWPEQIDQLFTDFLEPNFLCIHDAQGIKNLLLRSDPPFEWITANVPLRAAEIVALEKVSGGKIDARLKEQILPFREDIERSFIRSEIKDFDALMDFLFSK